MAQTNKNSPWGVFIFSVFPARRIQNTPSPGETKICIHFFSRPAKRRRPIKTPLGEFLFFPFSRLDVRQNKEQPLHSPKVKIRYCSLFFLFPTKPRVLRGPQREKRKSASIFLAARRNGAQQKPPIFWMGGFFFRFLSKPRVLQGPWGREICPLCFLATFVFLTKMGPFEGSFFLCAILFW